MRQPKDQPLPKVKKKKSRSRLEPIIEKGVNADSARVVANKYMLFQYPLGVLAGTAHPVSLLGFELWIVPILLTSPCYGAIGDIGVIAIDAKTGQVIGATPKEEVGAAGERLRKEKKKVIQAAFRKKSK